MKLKRVLVLTDHMPWGHRAIAKAIHGYLSEEKDLKVDFLQVKAETFGGNGLYDFCYKYVPGSNKLFHKISFNKLSQKFIEKLARLGQDEIYRVLKRYKPDLVISCYFFHSHTLAYVRKKYNFKFKLWTVVADPWTINPLSFVKKADMNLVYDEVGKKMAVDFGIPESKILVTGWWVRNEMKLSSERSKVRKVLRFDDDLPVIFVGGASLGTMMITKVLPMLLMAKKPIGVIFNCGTDKTSYDMVNGFVKLFKKKFEGLVKIKVYGWVEDMAKILSACDIVFGKAGPNFLFDVNAMKLPFVSITHIGGQEDGNVEIIRKKKLGWVKEDIVDLVKFFKRYSKRPAYYHQKFRESIEVEAKKNQKTKEIIKREVMKSLSNG